jgi:hypothetical protein
MTTLINTFGMPSTLAQFGSGSGMFAGMYIFGILVFAVLVIGGIASLGGLVYIWVRALKQPSLAQGLANCGRCHYGVRGSTTMTCPECGADFREVGIISPAMRKIFISPALFVVLWTMCLWLPGCVVSGIAVALGPQEQIEYEDVDIAPPDTKAAGYDNIMLSRTPYGMYDGPAEEFLPLKSRYIDVDIYGPNANEWYEVDLATNTYEDYMSSYSNPQKFDKAALESWMKTVGADLTNPDVKLQIDQLYTNIMQTSATGLVGNHWSTYTINSQSNWTEDQPAGWFVLIQPVFWLLVYAGGIGLYFFLKHRYDNAMAQFRDQMIANDASASPDLPSSIPTPDPPAQAGL